MTGNPENPSAFPIVYTTETRGSEVISQDIHLGMTLRDYFAGQALAGFCANDGKHKRAVAHSEWLGKTAEHQHERMISAILSRESYEYADAMLKERVK